MHNQKAVNIKFSFQYLQPAIDLYKILNVFKFKLFLTKNQSFTLDYVVNYQTLYQGNTQDENSKIKNSVEWNGGKIDNIRYNY